MKRTMLPLAIVVLCLSAGLAVASAGSGGRDKDVDQKSPPAATLASTDPAANSRGEAEQFYALAYEEIAQAKREAADGKAKNVEKRYRRAIEAANQAVALDARYHEAWSLVGFAWRKLGDYDKAFAAYEKCLAIQPDYAPAREYMGEAWLEKGDANKAREQLTLLESYGDRAAGDAKTLRAAIEAYEAAHPGTATKSADTTSR
jgi:tetratricopeptide (TPR) repeat protein